jgi:hypothetical protein
MLTPFPIEFMIIVTFAVVATLFVILISVALVIHKAIEAQKIWREDRLYEEYSVLFAELLLQELPSPAFDAKPSAVFRQYDRLIAPIQAKLKGFSTRRRRRHRHVLQKVLIDFAQDLSGEAAERLVYFFYAFGFVEELCQLLKSRHWWIRAQAARDLGLVRARRGISYLTAALEDAHPDVRNQAMQSLIVLVGVEALRTIFRISRELSEWTQVELSVIVMGFKERAVPYLIEALDSSDESVVLFSIEMLSQIGFVAAVDPLLNVLSTHPRTNVRAKAAEALGRLGDGRAEEPLLSNISSGDSGLRLSAIEALGRIGSPKAVQPLLRQWERREIRERVLIARAIARCGEEGLSVIRTIAQGEPSLNTAIVGQVLEELGYLEEAA